MTELHVKLEDYPTLATFLRQELTATIAVPIDENGTIHAASLLYYHTKQPLRFYFMTGRDTEKCRLLIQKGSVPAACVVGTYKGVDFTLQMRGKLQIADAKECGQVVKDYYEKRGNRHDDVNDPQNVLLEFTPTWARFTDYSKGYGHHFLEV